MRAAPLAVMIASFAVTLVASTAPVRADDPVGHVLTLVDATTRPDGCLLRFTLRRSTARERRMTADLAFEFADPREGHDGPVTASVELDLDDTRPTPRPMRVAGLACDDLRPLRFTFACRTPDGRCGTGTAIALRNFRRLEITEDRIAP